MKKTTKTKADASTMPVEKQRKIMTKNPQIYFGLFDGSTITNHDISIIALSEGKSVYANDLEKVRDFAKTLKGVRKEIEHPSIKHMLWHGNLELAIQVYYDRHPNLGLDKCKENVKKYQIEVLALKKKQKDQIKKDISSDNEEDPSAVLDDLSLMHN